MKHSLIVTGCLVAVVGAFALTIHTHQNTVQAAKVKAANVANQVQQQLATNRQLQAKVKQDERDRSALHLQCEIGVADYGLLSSAERVKAVKPVCPVGTAIAK